MFFKTVGKLLHLLTVHPKLVFLGALKKALIVPEDGSYQTQYFAKLCSSPLNLTLHIHFYLICSACESATKTALETRYFVLFLKKLTKNLEKKLVIMFVLME